MYNKLCQAKDSERKEELHKVCKACTNHVTNLPEEAKCLFESI